jgi:hypothetical protein
MYGFGGGVSLNRPGVSGDSEPWEGWGPVLNRSDRVTHPTLEPVAAGPSLTSSYPGTSSRDDVAGTYCHAAAGTFPQTSYATGGGVDVAGCRSIRL